MPSFPIIRIPREENPFVQTLVDAVREDLKQLHRDIGQTTSHRPDPTRNMELTMMELQVDVGRLLQLLDDVTDLSAPHDPVVSRGRYRYDLIHTMRGYGQSHHYQNVKQTTRWYLKQFEPAFDAFVGSMDGIR